MYSTCKSKIPVFHLVVTILAINCLSYNIIDDSQNHYASIMHVSRYTRYNFAILFSDHINFDILRFSMLLCATDCDLYDLRLYYNRCRWVRYFSYCCRYQQRMHGHKLWQHNTCMYASVLSMVNISALCLYSYN